MAEPIAEAAPPMAGAHSMDRPAPTKMVTKGVTIISIWVVFDTAFPASEAKIVTMRTA